MAGAMVMAAATARAQVAEVGSLYGLGSERITSVLGDE